MEIYNMKQHEIKIPSDVEYRVTSTGGRCFQPQYKDKRGRWVDFTYKYHDQRDGDVCECNKTFGTLEEANQYIDDHVKQREVVIHYRTKE